MDAAAGVFLERGYLGTSVDAVAAAVPVSKQTVYKHFGDKEGLFTQMVVETIEEVSAPFLERLEEVGETQSRDADLRELGRSLIRIVMQPRVQRLRRLVIAEVGRFPELGRRYFEAAPRRTIDGLARLLGRLSERGLLRVEYARLAAAHFNWLVVSIPMNEVMLTGDHERFTAAELDAFADSGVEVFLSAYGRR